jgi:predicted nuclease with TOPRIM domain
MSGDSLPAALRDAEQEVDVTSSRLGLLHAEYNANLDTLESLYYPKAAPLAAVVFVTEEHQANLEAQIQWLEKKIVAMEQKKHMFIDSKDMAPIRKDFLSALNPRFEEAFMNMDAVTREELAVLRGYEHPPQIVLDTIFMVMRLREEPEISWTSARVMLSETYYYSFFSYKARQRTKQDVSSDDLRALERYCESPETTAEAVRRLSRPCAAMAQWLRALRDYYRLQEIMKPRQQTIDAAKEELQELRRNLQKAKEDLFDARKRLENIDEERRQRLRELRQRYDDTMLPLQEMFFEANEKFNEMYSSPRRDHLMSES